MPIPREPNSEPLPGYRLIAPLGSGGFGEVWKCEAAGGLFKAIKFVFGNLNTLDTEAVRALQEQSALERVKAVRHPFILSIERIEIVAGELIIVTELADKSLYDRLVECQKAGQPGMPRDELLSFLRDAAEALDLMNFQHDLQHLDIKPRNLFLVSNHVKVADFGLVKNLEQMNATPGNVALLGGVTPLYAAPETFRGIISRHSDQYSLAIVYQELLTGQRPFNGKNPRQLAVQHCQESPDLSTLPEVDRPMVAKALAKNPQDRFPSCITFLRALISGQMPEARKSNPSGNLGLLGRSLSFPESLDDFMLSPADVSPVSPSGSPAPRGGDGAVEKTGVFQVMPHYSPPGGERPLTPEEAHRLSVTVAQPLNGSLRPTLVIGVGHFGKQALQALRCRFIDRFGSLSKLGLLRFLYLDTDAKGIQDALKGPPEQALSQGELCHLPLQPMAHYRRNKALLEQTSAWLPLEKLYGLPRSLETDGVRALGRLALTESYNRLMARLRREIQLMCSPDNLDQSVNLTGLALRSDHPQVYVIAAAGGGTGGGILLDLGYNLRKLLLDQGQSDPDVTAFVMCGAPSDPATPAREQANLYALLTELNHFSDPAVSFAAEYGLNGTRVQDGGAPFQSVYLLRMGHRHPEGLKESSARLASYIFHDLSTPLGSRLAASRLAQRFNGGTPFRSFGTYAIWFPRGLLLRVAARRACYRLIDEWQHGRQKQNWWPELGVPASPSAVKRETVPSSGPAAAASSLEFCLQSEEERRSAIAMVCDRVMADSLWHFETLRKRVEEAATTTQDGSPGVALTNFLTGLETQSQTGLAREDPAGWCRQAVERVREWVGNGVAAVEETSEWRKSRLHRGFDQAVQTAADDLLETLAKPAQELFDSPGYRLAAAQAAYEYLIACCRRRAEEFQPLLREQTKATEQCWRRVDEAMDACMHPGSFMLFAGSRIRKLLRSFLDRLNAYARQRLAEESLRSVQSVYKSLQGRLHDLIRDMSFCGQRLIHLAETMISPAESGDDLSGTVIDLETGPPLQLPASSSQMLGEAARSLASRVVLPEGAPDLDLAASQFLDEVPGDIWQRLDEHLQGTVLVPLGGLLRMCVTSSDLSKSLGIPLLESAAEFLGAHLPTTDVCEAEISSAKALGIDLPAQAKAYFQLASPSIRAESGEREQGYLLVSSSDAGSTLGNLAKAELNELQVVRIANQTDLLFCREQTALKADELKRILAPCADAYWQNASAPQTSPHVRCDILDWVPIEAGA